MALGGVILIRRRGSRCTACAWDFEERKQSDGQTCKLKLAPEVGFEPTTNRLTADRSTTELLWIVALDRAA